MQIVEPDDEILLRPYEAARLLGVDVSTVRRYALDGTLPVSVLKSGHRRFKRSDVTKMLKKAGKP